jgi:hypothetical protein
MYIVISAKNPKLRHRQDAPLVICPYIEYLYDNRDLGALPRARGGSVLDTSVATGLPFAVVDGVNFAAAALGFSSASKLAFCFLVGKQIFFAGR